MDVVVSLFQSLTCFFLVIDAWLYQAWLEQVDRTIQGHGLAAGRPCTGFRGIFRLHTRHIPFQASELDGETLAQAQDRDAIWQVPEVRANHLHFLILTQNFLDAQLLAELVLHLPIRG